MQNKGFIVAIDGPSGAGKSTVAHRLARRLGGRLLDTGTMYRGVAYHALLENAHSEKEFRQIAQRLEFRYDVRGKTLLVNGKDLGLGLRTERVSAMASHVSQFRGVRKALTKMQRELARQWSHAVPAFPAVVEGRDIGTVVFPHIQYKFFVTASSRVRARRRFEQLKKQGFTGITLKAILAKHRERDRRDCSRKLAPLRKASDAIVVNTSRLSLEAVVEKMVVIVLRD